MMVAPVPGKMAVRALEGAGALAGRAVRGRRAAPLAAAVEDVAPMPQGMLALPAPERMLALPAPGPGLPPGAAKPRGGQWWAIKDFDGANYSPEAAARTHALDFELSGWVPEEQGVVGGRVANNSPAAAWLERAMTKYYKNEFGSPDDPLRALAERGMHYDPEMTPERWQQTVNDILQEDTIGSVLLPRNPKGGMPGAGDDLRANAMLSMPWLAKLPVTDKIYGIGGGGLDLTHFTDEFLNALNPEASGIPLDLAVRPESLGRMTFPQAVEQVGKINQYRATEMERAALSSASNPAVQTFKEYTENNPMGLRWTELKTPGEDAPLPEGWLPDGKGFYNDNTGDTQSFHPSLQDALKYEGDTMGHCVGGYCDEVASGKSRIFSLRDAKGEPHVTIETSPVHKPTAAVEHLRQLGVLPEWQNYIKRVNTRGVDTLALSDAWLRERGLPPVEYSSQDIVQIKGKQNRAPKDDYLPFVQDFVKGQKWGNVGDLRNTGLVKLPDGRYITRENYQQVIDDNRLDEAYKSYDFNAHGFPGAQGLDDDAWQQFQRHFEGYAVGGRVSADRCFSRHPMSVR
jgi:hypothetical protein